MRQQTAPPPHHQRPPGVCQTARRQRRWWRPERWRPAGGAEEVPEGQGPCVGLLGVGLGRGVFQGGVAQGVSQGEVARGGVARVIRRGLGWVRAKGVPEGAGCKVVGWGGWREMGG